VHRLAPALTAMCMALAGCSAGGPEADTAAQLEEFDASFARLQNGVREKMAAHPGDERDFRGRTFRDDMAQWVLAEHTRQTIAELRANAVSAGSRMRASESLGVARRMLTREFERSQGIVDYWVKWPAAPHWRRHWTLVFEANQVPVEPPDAELLAIESRMLGALEQGEFGMAVLQARAMQKKLDAALYGAADRLARTMRADLVFAPRKTPCMPGGSLNPARSGAAIVRGEDVDAYYPADAKRRGEQGTLVLRVRVDEKGCGTQVAVRVRSGFESIDAAALTWFETARFSPGNRAGRPIVSELDFKIHFKMGG
jgi:TonB family protein